MKGGGNQILNNQPSLWLWVSLTHVPFLLKPMLLWQQTCLSRWEELTVQTHNHHFLLHPKKKKSQQPMGWNLESGHNGALHPSSSRQAWGKPMVESWGESPSTEVSQSQPRELSQILSICWNAASVHHQDQPGSLPLCVYTCHLGI